VRFSANRNGWCVWGFANLRDSHYDLSVKRAKTIPVPSSPALLKDLAAIASETGLSQADMIRQSLKLGMPALRSKLGKTPRRRLSLVQHFKGLKGLALPPYLV
jgi:hypothetical protein